MRRSRRQTRSISALPARNSGRLRGLAIATCYARWLVWIRATEPDALAQTPEARATRERVISYLHDLHDEITIRGLHGYACRLKRALELICPDADWSWFRPILGRLERRARAAKSVARPFVPADQLSAFGTELMELAETGSVQTDLEQAELFRDGLIIAFLASRPLRLKNMLELEIGIHLIESVPDMRSLCRRRQPRPNARWNFRSRRCSCRRSDATSVTTATFWPPAPMAC